MEHYRRAHLAPFPVQASFGKILADCIQLETSPPALLSSGTYRLRRLCRAWKSLTQGLGPHAFAVLVLQDRISCPLDSTR
ncbi:hypothetical protein K523DRAFT_323816 [Schizophyllum commune Tattone D]|nr:hypothetical protein K523DRAFT_323816 [Schizophyllum commune Tattone D]